MRNRSRLPDAKRTLSLVALPLVALGLSAQCVDLKNPLDGIEPPDFDLEREINAAAGGAVDLGDLSLNFPPSALSEDTTVTVEVKEPRLMPEANRIVGQVYDLRPDGLQFDQPVEIQLDLGDVELEGDDDVVIAWLDDDGVWQPLEDSRVDGSQVIATTTHFTPFAIVFRAGEGQVEGVCAETDFSACGGSLVGTWDYEAGCMTLGTAPDFGGCEGAESGGEMDISGYVEFSASTYSVDQDIQFTSVMSLPSSCLPPGYSCAMVAEQFGDPESPSTYEEQGGRCVISGATHQQTVTATGTYATTSAGGIIFDDSPDGPSVEYCVEGSEATIRFLDTDRGDEQYYFLRKR